MDMAQSNTVPLICQEHFSTADWAALGIPDRMSIISFMQAEQAQTTQGLVITFPRIAYPGAAAAIWIVPDATGQPQYKPVIAGAVLYKQPVRAYWPIGNPIAKDPPMCSSPDGRKPDTPGPINIDSGRQANSCAECLRAVFGTGKEGQGQACKARINVFTLMDANGDKPGAPLALEDVPTLISVPPSQLKTFSEYAVQVRKSAAGSLLAHTTVFGLKDDKSRSGVEFKALSLSTGKKLSFDQMRKCREIGDAFEDQFRSRGFVSDEETDEEDKVPF
jgi:hypothetical protein